MPPVRPTSTAAVKPKAPQAKAGENIAPRPTPTQEESNLAAAGVHLETHAWDGTPLQNPHGTPPDRPDIPPGTLPPPSVAPVLSSLAPATAVVGSIDVTVTVNGSGFYPSSVIVWNSGDEPTTFISATQVSTLVKPSTASGAFSVPITVRNGDKVSNMLTFQFTEAAK